MSSEALLQAVIDDIQTDDPTRYGAAVDALVSQGPLQSVAVRPDVELFEGGQDAMLLALRAELWAWLREQVRLREAHADVFGRGIWLNDRVRLVGNGASLGIEGTRRNVAIVQLAFLVDRVGLRNVRVCGVWDCPHFFVKTYRKEFCSVQCQKKHYMRNLRARERAHQERRRAQRQRLKGASK